MSKRLYWVEMPASSCCLKLDLVWVLGEAGKDAVLKLRDVEVPEGADRTIIRLCIVVAVAVGRELLGTGSGAEVIGTGAQEGCR